MQENSTCGVSIVGDAHDADPMDTDEGGASAPKFDPETENTA
jgi:hypothetical protein